MKKLLSELSLSSGLRVLILLLAIQLSQGLRADTQQLLFLEAQAVGGWSSLADAPVWYSNHQKDAMQKPSLGFDYIRKFNNGFRDTGTFALQYRVAYNEKIRPRFESQIYNLYYKHKLPGFDAWIGSNKPASGLTSYLDNHAALLPDMAMRVFTFDRDWGIGAERETRHWSFKASATNGAGMRIYNKEGNYLLAGRVGYGNLNQDSYTLGVSGVHGKVLEAMGYNLGHLNSGADEYILHAQNYIGLDGAGRWRNLELKADLLKGEFYDQPALGIFGRAGLFLLPEDRLGLELQIMHSRHAIFENTDYSAGLAFRLNPDLTFRALYNYHAQDESQRVIGQIYYNKPFTF